MKNLVIVESPTKARTISRFLGKDYEVLPTVGHIRDLPKSKMGVEVNGGVKMNYEIVEGKKKVVSQLKSLAKKAKMIWLATDPDREGEAIAWHVKQIMANSEGGKNPARTKRIAFHEITKEAVEEAIGNAGKINMDLVDAQQARRALDRLVGYSLSPILWKKVRRGLSAGRVQSVAVRLIVEREKEREKFKSEKFFKVGATVAKGQEFETELHRVEGKPFWLKKKLDLFDGSYTYSKSIFAKKSDVDSLKLDKVMVVESVEGRESRRHPGPAFTTSRLQQAAANSLGWSGRQTMNMAQRLYEKGLITYHRTDSVYLSSKAMASFAEFIKNKYGPEYVAKKPRVYKNKSKNAQEAHEAIRPTQVGKQLPEGLGAGEKKLYQMIWKRAVATQAAEAVVKKTNVSLSCGKGLFRSVGVQMLFDGFLKINGGAQEDQMLPKLVKGDQVKVKKVKTEEAETNPPPRYNDASLVKSLENQGIGRPSTYAPIISTILNRRYVEKEDGRFYPTSLGVAANKFLVKNFDSIMSLPFTAEMEDDLDEVSRGELDWQKMIKKFWRDFAKKVKGTEKTAERVKIETEKLGKKCPECKKGELVIRLGRFGKFISCSRFPECKYTAAYKELAGFKCPKCGKPAVIKRTKRGRQFYGCGDYPKCKWASWKKPN